MEMVETVNGTWQVRNLSNGDVLHEGDIGSCEDFMYGIFLGMSGI